jgi:radical SAM-linked protein
MDRTENLERKQARIGARVRRGVNFKHHSSRTSFIEAVFSRGDRALCDVLEQAWRRGARFDGWDEHFAPEAWRAAFAATGVSPEFYAYSDLDPARPLPWHVIDSRVNRKWLALELKRAMEAATLSICGPQDCHGCAPFARECVKGIVSVTTGRPLDSDLPLLSTPAACGPRPPTAPRQAAPSASGEALERYRYRGRFTKAGRMRYLGHLDTYRLLLRGLRRAAVPLVYSMGFNPKPRVAFGPALPIGLASEGEYLDFESHERIDLRLALSRLNEVLPAGVRFAALCEVPRDLPGLGQVIRAARYRAHVRGGLDVASCLGAFRERSPVSVRAERKGRPTIFDLSREMLELEPIDAQALRLTLAVREQGASLKPEEALREICGSDLAGFRLVREDLLMEWNGQWVDPLVPAVEREAGVGASLAGPLA